MTHTPLTRRDARRVTLFLDVDGVLNSYPVAGPRFYLERRRRTRAWNFELHYRPKVVRFLDSLPADRQVDIVWLSTWSNRCRTEVEPKLGFRHSFEIIEMPDDTFNRYANDPAKWWKAQAVRTWLDEHPGRRAIWIDDDLAAPRTHAAFAADYPERLLMIAPEFRLGLHEKHFDLIRGFTHPRRVRTSARLSTLVRRSGLPSLLRRPPLPRFSRRGGTLALPSRAVPAPAGGTEAAPALLAERPAGSDA